MNAVIYFPKIQIPVPFDRIYRRLGYQTGITRLEGERKEEVATYIEDASMLLALKGAVRRISLKKRSEETIELENGVIFQSRNLIKMLGKSEELIIMAATGGEQIMNTIKRDAKEEKLTRSIVFDATASEMVDASLEWITRYCNMQLRRENKRVAKKRFSCGYGDFLLENQHVIYDILHLDSIGIYITKSCMLVPEKSVTAISVIEKKETIEKEMVQ